MSKPPRLSGKEVVRLFERKGWQLVRVKGSHHILKSSTGKIAVVPVHGKESLHTGLLHNLLHKHLKLSEEDIAKL